jgi:hypothetical protein
MSVVGLSTTLCVKQGVGTDANSKPVRPAFPSVRAFVSMGART